MSVRTVAIRHEQTNYSKSTEEEADKLSWGVQEALPYVPE